MGALTILVPGRGGPCSEPCEHHSCRQHRDAASSACCVCGRALGYGVPVYFYPTRTGHAECIERGVNASMHEFIRRMAELAVDHVLRTEHGYSDAELSRARASRWDRSAKRKPDAELPWVLNVERFMFPEHDLEVVIPSGRSKRPNVRVERHTVMLGMGRNLVTAVVRREE